ncbi:unnamed protein product [Clonostachys byssicola]|uniref:Amino acid permease/ SLC12A domain-containing protein n=1 Tax=Clonostachys byssicola TaxID=160290 RepID=A0A9N9UFU3_9HYPO|nr:unnamed protein product [Clonostachys byssicola]
MGFFVMASLGEMAALLPINKSFGGYLRNIDPAVGFAIGWKHFFKNEELNGLHQGLQALRAKLFYQLSNVYKRRR